ncbi:MAG: hypothetical protein L7F78_27000, partial [Syntrophales bacterium LBB04]|nr:hypothetical protein [Syntrophales bacterium LBB04]
RCQVFLDNRAPVNGIHAIGGIGVLPIDEDMTLKNYGNLYKKSVILISQDGYSIVCGRDKCIFS